MPLLLDTGVIYALADADDEWHLRARRLLDKRRELVLTTATVLPEVTYLLRLRLGRLAELRFVQSIADGEIAVENVTVSDLTRCAVVLQRYPDIGFVDASIVSVAERLRLRAIATTDRRHFTQIRPSHVPAFDLVP